MAVPAGLFVSGTPGKEEQAQWLYNATLLQSNVKATLDKIVGYNTIFGNHVLLNGTTSLITVTDAVPIQNIFVGTDIGDAGTLQWIMRPWTMGENGEAYIFSKGTVWIVRLVDKDLATKRCKLEFEHAFATTNGKWKTDDYVVDLGALDFWEISYDNSDLTNNPVFMKNFAVVASSVVPSFTPSGAATTDVGSDLIIGNRAAADRTVLGMVDNVALWSGDERTVGEFATDFDNELVGSETNLVWYSKMNTGSGVAAVDEVNTNNGVITAGDWGDHELTGVMAYEEDGGRLYRIAAASVVLLDWFQEGVDASKPSASAANNEKWYIATDTDKIWSVIAAAQVEMGITEHTDFGDVIVNQHHNENHLSPDHNPGPPSNIGTANASGSSDDGPRLDHVHNHPTGLGVNLHHNEAHTNTTHNVGTPSDIGTSNAEGVSTSVPRLDHQHNHPTGLDTDLHHNQTHGSGEHTVGTPSDIGTSNASGASVSVPRLDHQHDHVGSLGVNLHHNQAHTMTNHTTGIPSNLGTTNYQGTSTSIPRLDHVHAHPSGLGIDLHHNRDHATRHTSSGDLLPVNQAGESSLITVVSGGAAKFAHTHP